MNAPAPALTPVGVDTRPLVVHLVYSLGVGGLETLLVDCINRMPAWRHAVVCLTTYTSFADRIARRDGFPVLDENFGTTIPGLYITGFSATRDFGPFFGFVKASPAAATLLVRELTTHN